MAFVYKDQENQVTNLRKFRETLNGNKSKNDGQTLKRPVLGVLNANSNAEKTGKFSKDFVQQSFPRKVQAEKSVCPFSVHIDDEENADVVKTKSTEAKDVTNKNLDTILEIPPKVSEFFARSTVPDVSSPTTSGDESMLLRSVLSESPVAEAPTLSPIMRPTLLPNKSSKRQLLDCDIYQKEILEHLKSLELQHRPKPNYMRRQPDVTYSMRAILVDWLVEVAEEYQLQAHTLFLSVSLVDRFLSVMSVVRTKLQLLGTAAMFVAAKYEEMYVPEVREFVFITDDSYTQKQVLRMEYLLLRILAFDISAPTTITFIEHFGVACEVPDKVLFLSMYLCELTLVDGDPYLACNESLIAASALALARHCLDYEEVWPENYATITGYRMHQLETCVSYLNSTHAKANDVTHKATRAKYTSNKYLNVSTIHPKSLDVKENILQMTEFKQLRHECS